MTKAERLARVMVASAEEDVRAGRGAAQGQPSNVIARVVGLLLMEYEALAALPGAEEALESIGPTPPAIRATPDE